MRGGTSHGPFFRASDLPADVATRDRVLLAALGSPDARQIDGIGGADPLTSKVGIVSPRATAGVDLEFLFAQVSLKEDAVDTTPNCGNMLAAVVPFALESGLLAARGDTTTLRVLTRNTGTLCDIEVQTPGGRVEYAGNARIDGVPGTRRADQHQFPRYRRFGVRRVVPRPAISSIAFDGVEVHLHRQRHAGGRDAAPRISASRL